ncbi:MAG: hypothetical protein U9P10_01275 [Thermodesulfobacteriota bacterium]|nr:hypothetical protein [Thermodesulfobacteriota bacterium]
MADIYGALLYPDGTIHPLIPDPAAGFQVTGAVDFFSGGFPALFTDLLLFELNEYEFLTLDHTGLPSGEYTWYMVLAEPGTDLLEGKWAGFDSVVFYLDRETPMQSTVQPQAEMQVHAAPSDVFGTFASFPLLETGDAAHTIFGNTTMEYAYACIS